MKRRSLVHARRVMRWLTALAIALGLAGCAGAGSGHALPLSKTDWTLVEVKDAPVVPGAGGRRPYIIFDPAKKRVTGDSGVNNFFGGYETNDGGLRLPRLASTRRAGPPEFMQLESAFFEALAATRSYRISDDELELLDAGGRTIARFRAERLVPSTVEK